MSNPIDFDIIDARMRNSAAWLDADVRAVARERFRLVSAAQVRELVSDGDAARAAKAEAERDEARALAGRLRATLLAPLRQALARSADLTDEQVVAEMVEALMGALDRKDAAVAGARKLMATIDRDGGHAQAGETVAESCLRGERVVVERRLASDALAQRAHNAEADRYRYRSAWEACRTALDESACSLETVAQAGARRGSELLTDLIDVRAYATSRARVARAALAMDPARTEEDAR